MIVDLAVDGNGDVVLAVDSEWSVGDTLLAPDELATIDRYVIVSEGETNVKTPTGSVLDVEFLETENRTFVTVRAADLDVYLGADDPESIIDRTLEIVRGADLEVDLGRRDGPVVVGEAGVDQFRQIIGIEARGESYRIEIAPAFDITLPGDLPEDVESDELLAAIDYPEYLSGFIAYRITNQSLNFFVDEADSQDLVFIHDEDSPADSIGEMIALDFDAFPDMESFYNADLALGEDGYVTPNRLVGFGMGPDGEIARGLRPGGITYVNFEGFELDLGYGDNTLLVDTVHERDDGVETFTRIRSGRGDDTINISLQRPEDPSAGAPWVEVDAGEGDDRIDAQGDGTLPGAPTSTGTDGPDARRGITGSAAGLGPSTLDLDLVGGLGGDTIIGGSGNDLIHGDFGSLDFVVNGRRPEANPIAESTRIGEGGDDRLEGRAGNDRIFGGAGNDTVRGDEGQDILFGDYGKVTRLSATRTLVETTGFFEGGADVVDGGAGNDLIFGGAGGDALFGTFSDDLLIGEYARINLENGIARSLVRLGQGELDVAASAFFGLYDPRFGPFAEFILPEQVASSAALPERPLVSLESADPNARRASAGGSLAVMPYEVEQGDTLWKIAARELGDPYRWSEIYNLSRDVVADPDRIEPDERLRIPGQRGRSSEQLEADRQALAEMRELLAGIDAANAAEANAGWGFFNPLAVGAGPPVEEGSLPDAPTVDDASRDLAPEEAGAPIPDAEGASLLEAPDANEEGSDPALSGMIWSSLVGWRATSNPTKARSRDKWLRFDDHAGRFA